MPKRQTRPSSPFKFCLFPGYRYCGPGCSGPGAPFNGADACCKAHDECYRKHGRSCLCDLKFMRCLESRINPHTREGRQARLMHNYMRLQTRRCHEL
ncbi:phospholipase [Pontibacillus halophilus]|uniref:phospholipase n=1 Tax=Pontibacillus halophilus TaxID=516704 RepID=UPI0009DB7868|nr:phospholipase [Pontibacillus halophilus]